MSSVFSTTKSTHTPVAPPLEEPIVETDSIQDHQSEQSKYMQTLATKPALTAVAGMIASFPIPKIFFSNAVPLLHALDNSQSEHAKEQQNSE